MIKMIMMLTLLISCGKHHQYSQTASSAQIEATPVVQEKALETNEPQFKIKIKMVNFSAPHKKKVYTAAGLIKRVLRSDEFKQEILDGRFTDTKGLSNDEIYEKIMQGSENLSPKVDYEMDVILETFYADAVTVGYTMTGSQKVYMNRKFLHRHSPAEFTTNIMHEWLHKLGFDHEVEDTPARRNSVPYSVGYIVRKLAKKY